MKPNKKMIEAISIMVKKMIIIKNIYKLNFL